jgi:hypothetical protein
MDLAHATVLPMVEDVGGAATGDAATSIELWKRAHAALAPDVREKLAALPIR